MSPTLPPLRIAEIFYSIQGEGMLTGVPSVFLRLSGCNLRCDWCDTPYASWNPEGDDRMFGSVLAEVRRHWAKHVVVTGGEPMIHPGIVDLTKKLQELELHVTVETAGTVYEPVACDLMSISPKLAHSTPTRREGGRWAAQHERLRYQPEILKRLMSMYPYQLKFVLRNPSDMAEVNAIIKETDADKARVLLMAEGVDASTLYERGQWIVEACKQFGYCYSPRLHIDLWGNQRGR